MGTLFNLETYFDSFGHSVDINSPVTFESKNNIYYGVIVDIKPSKNKDGYKFIISINPKWNILKIDSSKKYSSNPSKTYLLNIKK